MEHIFFFFGGPRVRTCTTHVWAFLTMSALLVVQGCELFSQTLALRVVVPKLSEEHHFKELNNTLTRTVFYIDEKGSTQATISGNISSRTSIFVRVEKNRVIPVLVCGNIIGSDNHSHGTHNCLFAQGGTYPFDGSNSKLYLAPRHKAQVASLLLDLHEKGGRIELFNVAKLYASIQSRSPDAPFDTHRLYDYLNNGTLSAWGIKPLDTVTVRLPHKELQYRTWVNLSFWGDAIIGDDFAIDLYPGKWAFVSPDDTPVPKGSSPDFTTKVHLMSIYVDNIGNYQLVRTVR